MHVELSLCEREKLKLHKLPLINCSSEIELGLSLVKNLLGLNLHVLSI